MSDPNKPNPAIYGGNINFNHLIRDRVYKYLTQCPPAISGQHGHDQTFKVAVVLVWGFCLPRDEALGYLRDYNTRCLPPWTDPELEHKIDSAIETFASIPLAPVPPLSAIQAAKIAPKRPLKPKR
jgi:hypothetical protein